MTPQTFPASQIIGVNFGTPSAPVAGSNQPMTPWKIMRARKMYEDLNLDLSREEPCIAISSAEIEAGFAVERSPDLQAWTPSP